MTSILPPIHTSIPNFSSNVRVDILKKINSHPKFNKQTHFINGRWENQYLDPYSVPEVKEIFLSASIVAKNLINTPVLVPHQGLGLSFDEYWFNITNSGESTGWHDHKMNAVISGVYYLDVPENSGDIQFRIRDNDGWKDWFVKSETGSMILFDAKLEHAVSENKSECPRVSLAFNLYTLPLDIQNESNDYSSQNFY